MVCDRVVSFAGSVAHGADSDSLLLSGGIAKTGADDDAVGTATTNESRVAGACHSCARSEPDDAGGLDSSDYDSTASSDGRRRRAGGRRRWARATTDLAGD